MTFDSSLLQLLEDTITIEPITGVDFQQQTTYGAAVTYPALIERGTQRVIGAGGREATSTVQVIIPDRVTVDVRSRITLPAGFSPLQPPIMGVDTVRGLGLDNTRLLL